MTISIQLPAQWLTTGNTTFGTEKLGSSAGNFNLEFYINNVNFLQLLTNGDLNIVTNTSGYKIDGNFVLRNHGINSNIYVGVGAGNSNATAYNTFVGYNTGAGVRC